MSGGRIVVVGGTGTIGSAVAAEMSRDHEVIVAGRTASLAVDLADLESIRAFTDRLRDQAPLEAIVVCAGGGLLGTVDDLDLDQFLPRLAPKLRGQVAIAKAAPGLVRPGGAVVLTSGILERRPQAGMSHLAIINASLRAFAAASATEGRSVRTCVVSPGLVEESPQEILDLFPGMPRVAASDLACVYRRLIESGSDGETVGLPEA